MKGHRLTAKQRPRKLVHTEEAGKPVVRNMLSLGMKTTSGRKARVEQCGRRHAWQALVTCGDW